MEEGPEARFCRRHSWSRLELVVDGLGREESFDGITISDAIITLN
jgi:hypothetical protein